MVASLDPIDIVITLLALGIPGLGLVIWLCGPRTSTSTRLALILPLGFATIACSAYLLALLGALTIAAVLVAWIVLTVGIWVLAIRSRQVRPHLATARTAILGNPWRTAAAGLLFGGLALVRWTYQPLVNLAAAPLRYWADGVEIADAHGFPETTLQYGKLLVPTVSKVMFNSFQGAMSLVLGREPLGSMGALLFVVSIGLALGVFAFACALGLRYTAPIVVLVAVISTDVYLNFATDLDAARAENWGRLVAFGAFLLLVAAFARPAERPTRRQLVAAGVLLGIAAATHLVAAAALVAMALAWVLARAIIDRTWRPVARALAGICAVAVLVAFAAVTLPPGDLGFGAAVGDTTYADVRAELDLPADVDPSLYIAADGHPETLSEVGTGPGALLSWLSAVMLGRDPTGEPGSPVVLIVVALVGLLSIAALLRWGDRRLRRLAVIAVAFAAIILGTGLAFSIRYDSWALANFGNRRLFDYLAIPGVLIVAGLFELAAQRAPGRLNDPRQLGAIAFALVALVALVALPKAEAEPLAVQTGDLEALEWISENVPCEARILSDRRTVATFQAMTGHPGVVEGMGPHIRPQVLVDAIGNMLEAQRFFARPSTEYLDENGIGAIVVSKESLASMGSASRFVEVDPATLEAAPFLTVGYDGPTATVFTVNDFAANPSLPAASEAPGYDCAPAPVPAATAAAPVDPPGPPWRGLTLLSDPAVDESRPLLSGLSVTASGIEQRPDFEPRILRYALYPSPDSDPIAITAEPLDPRDRVSVNGEPVDPEHPFTLDPPADGARVRVIVTDPRRRTTAYELVVLPVGFPVLNVSVLDPAKVDDEPLYLAVNSDRHSCTPPEQSCWIMTVDRFGVPVSYQREDRWVSDYKVQPTGQASYQVILGTVDPPYAAAVVLGPGGHDRELRATGFRRATNAHDFLMLPGGRLVFLAYADGEADDDGRTVSLIEGVVQLQEGARPKFRWSSAGQIPLSDSQRPPPDYLHLNSVVTGSQDDFVISARGTSQVYSIDQRTGKINWRLGGTSSDFRFVDDPYDGFCGQHSAVVLGNGHVLLFDNGQAASGWSTDLRQTPTCPPEVTASGRGLASRAVEYRLDPERGTARMVWSYEQATYAPSQGSVQRLSNGNTVIGWGANDDGLLATEVDEDGEKVFEISGTWPDGTATFSYRSFRFPR